MLIYLQLINDSGSGSAAVLFGDSRGSMESVAASFGHSEVETVMCGGSVVSPIVEYTTE